MLPETPSLGMGELYPVLTSQDMARMQRRYDVNTLMQMSYYSDMYALGGAGGGSQSKKGLDNQNDGRPTPKESKDLLTTLECKICMTQLVDTVIIPCGHAVLCRWCAEQHIPSSRVDGTRPKTYSLCPVCRTHVMNKVNTPSNDDSFFFFFFWSQVRVLTSQYRIFFS
ncbi:hypothetical protein ASPZODRAFT_130268 [Penicilliopsis zonata CBS 506.65]|uniref:RING-type domain-containing protein n=1 Tax=Penicilliopsis zonata CBS 506.65 TaxID=1073090 RepID=A0A1L9SMG8_9EURO|nr:hypothetical protein ASPZODRAFT_130268 [Penicilliopsis zonata CBS 506.65]OJJ48291.1 hypothetical protein ASPZODRAFT_130268 [Penicilliopsis zonata CBS 506.65]